MRLFESDHRTVVGRTMYWLKESCDVDHIGMLTPALVKRKLLYKPVNHEDEWKINLAKELVEATRNTEMIQEFSKDQLKDMLDFVCTD